MRGINYYVKIKGREVNNMKNSMIIVTILFAIIAAGGGFFAGMKYQESQQTTRFPFGRNGQEGFRQFGNAAFRPVRGSIISNDTNSITVKQMDGSSKIVILSGNTQFMKSAAGSKDDLKTGDTIMVFGSQNSDGSITAQNVQINPPMQRQIILSPTGGK